MSSTRVLTAAQATIIYLQNQFSSFDGEIARLIGGMFGIFGHGNVASISQAIFEYGDELPFFQPKNEQSMVHSAMGYAKQMRRRATLACSASIGPGSTNMLTGAAAATVNRIPVLLFASDTFAHRKPGNVLQQIEHPVEADLTVNDAFRPLSRFFDRISRPEQIIEALPEAMRVLTDPAETGAVTIAFPQDVEGEAYEYPEALFARHIWTIRRPIPGREEIASLLALIRAAKRPMIIAGGGVRYSAAEQMLKEFSTDFGIPVAETHAGKGVSLDAPLCLGGMGVTGTAASAQIAGKADLVIAIGTRMQDFATGSRSAFNNPVVKIAGLNVNARDAHKLAGAAVVGDAREGLAQLSVGLRSSEYATSLEYQNEVKMAVSSWRAAYLADIAVSTGRPLNQGTIVKLINEAAGPDDLVIAAAGTPPGEIHKGWDHSNGSRAFLEFGYSTMGHEIPAALGARLASPDVGEVFVIIGDGTYLMCPTEILTAAQEGAKLTIVVIENGGYQCIRDLQERTTGIDNMGNEFRARGNGGVGPSGPYFDVNYAMNAASLGALTFEVSTEAELGAALRSAREVRNRPTVIIAKAEKRGGSIGSGVWWDVGTVAVSESDAVMRASRATRANSRKQRFFV